MFELTDPKIMVTEKDLHDTAIILLWLGEQISEGVAADKLGTNRLDARKKRDEALEASLAMFNRLYTNGTGQNGEPPRPVQAKPPINFLQYLQESYEDYKAHEFGPPPKAKDNLITQTKQEFIEYCLLQHGLVIPEEMAVITYHDNGFGRLVEIGLTWKAKTGVVKVSFKERVYMTVFNGQRIWKLAQNLWDGKEYQNWSELRISHSEEKESKSTRFRSLPDALSVACEMYGPPVTNQPQDKADSVAAFDMALSVASGVEAMNAAGITMGKGKDNDQ